MTPYIKNKNTSPSRFHNIDLDDLVRRYTSGQSENSIARSLGVGRGPIRARLIHCGVAIRGQKEANRLMMSKRSPLENRWNSSAAHEAVRGRCMSFKEKRQRAVTRQTQGLLGANVSEQERKLFRIATEMGLQVIPQYAIGKYNVDFLIKGTTIAVEVLGGGIRYSSPVFREGFRKRFEDITDRGYSLILVWVGKYRIDRRGVKQLITFRDMFRRSPSLVGQEYMIFGDGKFVSFPGSKRNQPSSVSRPCDNKCVRAFDYRVS